VATRRQAVISGSLPAGGPLAATVPLGQAATAGSTLIVVMAGVIGTARITDGSGTTFTKRTTYGGGSFDVSVSDFTAAGGETAVHITKNADFNLGYYVLELSPVTFSSWSNNGPGSTANSASDFSCAPTAVTLASGAGVLIAGWVAEAAAGSIPYSGLNQWRGFGPLGQLDVSAGVQPSTGGAPDLIWAAGVADVTASGRWPVSAAAGEYAATSQWVRGAAGLVCAQALYTDTSGVPTNPPAANAIVAENSLPGTARQNWHGGTTATDATIAGYTDRQSYEPGDTVSFKVDSTGHAWRAEVFRLGYYGWEELGARRVTANITGTVVAQPAPTVDGTLGSTSCAWTTNASWTIPSTATPGRYYVLFRRTDEPGHISSAQFVVRGDPAGRVAVVVPDLTLAAYNLWGATTDHGDRTTGTWSGRSLYQAGADGAVRDFGHRAYACSLDRPNSVNSTDSNTGLFDSEYPMIAWMEAQGYDLTYLSDLDLDADPHVLETAGLAVLLGHHEYWTTEVYDAWRNARSAGVNIASISSNVALWKVRFAPADTARRTMICYKDSGTKDVSPGHAGTGYDPGGYTGTWRDTRAVPGEVNNTDRRSESDLLGQLFVASAPVALALDVPYASKSLPIWRNSAAIQALTTGQTYTTPYAVYGDEGDLPLGDAAQPTNLVNLCPTAVTLPNSANANGTLYASTVSGTAGMTLYRHASGALVWHTGTWRGGWSLTRWRAGGLDAAGVDLNWQNAFLAVLYDLGAVPHAARAMQPGIDTAPTDPATGAPSGDQAAVARAYGLTVPSTGSGMLMFFDF